MKQPQNLPFTKQKYFIERREKTIYIIYYDAQAQARIVVGRTTSNRLYYYYYIRTQNRIDINVLFLSWILILGALQVLMNKSFSIMIIVIIMNRFCFISKS